MHELGNEAPKMSISRHRLTYWQRTRRWIVQNFQNLIVSVVIICKRVCKWKLLQLYGGRRSPLEKLPGLRPWTTLEDEVPQAPSLSRTNGNSWRRRWLCTGTYTFKTRPRLLPDHTSSLNNEFNKITKHGRGWIWPNHSSYI